MTLGNNIALNIDNLSFFYGNAKTLSNINTNFEKNKVTAIIGPSGSGKSTLLRTLNRIYEIYPAQSVSGSIWYDGLDILSRDIDVNIIRKEIGMVFQKPTPFPMSIFENIAFAIRLHDKLPKGEIKSRVDDALRQSALWDEVKDKLHQKGSFLSGGQQQRLCIARTLAVKPNILLLDEPTSALDPISTLKIESLIAELKHKYTVIIVTHNLKQAQRVSDKTILMKDGHIIEEAETDQFFNSPQNQITKDYISNA